MAPRWIETVTGPFEEKRRYREYKARKAALPDKYRRALEALDRYLMYFGGISNGKTLLRMTDDLADLFEQSAADGTPIKDVLGEDPIEFVETFMANYSEGQWIHKERTRFLNAIAAIEREEADR